MTVQPEIFNRVGFERVWAKLPKKVGKIGAIKVWNRLKPTDDDVELMLQALDWQIPSDQWRRGFIPDPERWLSKGRWMDEPPAHVVPRRAQPSDETEVLRRVKREGCPHQGRHDVATRDGAVACVYEILGTKRSA